MKARLLFVPLVAFLLGAGCKTAYDVEGARARARIIDRPIEAWQPVSAGTNADTVLAGGLHNVQSLAAHLARLEGDAKALRKSLGVSTRGYFTVDETDRIEGLLFRYLACRETLWDIIAYYGNRDRHFGNDEQQTKAVVIALNAAVLLGHYSSRLVLTYLDDSAMIAKLNERHLVYDIPQGSYDSLFARITSRQNIEALRDSWALISLELQDKQSTLARIVNDDPVYAELLRDTASRYDSGQAAIETILRKKAIAFPKTTNAIRQNALVREAKHVTKDLSDNLYVAKGLLFNRISDIRRPMTSPAVFSADQVALIKSMLQPGDVIFTYTAGYMSNIFLPGQCKHGITYVGLPPARHAVGLTAERLTDATEGKRAKLAKDLAIASLPSGYDADVIEAVAEGVIFNSLDYLLKNHINRMVVLRPRVTPEDRAGALLATFLMVGGQYDFNFDFADVTYLCCTEVIYRSLQKRGAIEFTLVPRFGIQTLCADDIMLYHLRQKEPRFDVVLVADEDPMSKKHLARVQTGAEARARLQEMMSAKLSPPKTNN